ncbi:hypothetical protein NKG94_12925 [Micromonospora sp. M12]
MILGAAAVAVIIAEPDRLGVTSSGTRPDGSRPDGTRPDGSRPDGTRPDGSRPDGRWPGDVDRPGGTAAPDAADGRPGRAGPAAEQMLTAPLAGRQRAPFCSPTGCPHST